MSPAEMLLLLKEQGPLYLAEFERARASGRYNKIRLVVTGALNSFSMQGLVAWRHTLEDPSTYLRSAVEVADEGLTAMIEAKPSAQHAQAFYFAPALFLRLVLGLPAEGKCFSMLEGLRPESVSPATAQHALDYGVLSRLHGREDHEATTEAVNAVGPHKRMALLRDSWLNYLTLVRVATEGDHDAALACVRRAVELFDARRKDAFFKGGLQMDGGGPDNNHVVDFRLAAILVSFPGIAAPVIGAAAVHAWRWSRG